MTERTAILFDLCMALRKVPRGALADLGKRRLPADELAEKVAAPVILKHLERCGWHPEYRPGKLVTPVPWFHP